MNARVVSQGESVLSPDKHISGALSQREKRYSSTSFRQTSDRPVSVKPTRSLFSVAPPMNGLDVFRMVIAPGSAHSFRVSVVRYDVATVDKFLVTDSALSFLLDDFSIQQLPHLCGRPKFAKSSRVVWIFDALNAKMKSALLLGLLTTAAEPRPVYWAVFISTKLHKNSPVRVVSISGSLLAVSRRAVPSCSQTPIAQRMRPE